MLEPRVDGRLAHVYPWGDLVTERLPRPVGEDLDGNVVEHGLVPCVVSVRRSCEKAMCQESVPVQDAEAWARGAMPHRKVDLWVAGE
jgi:hypothetical protein